MVACHDSDCLAMRSRLLRAGGEIAYLPRYLLTPGGVSLLLFLNLLPVDGRIRAGLLCTGALPTPDGNMPKMPLLTCFCN